MKNRTWKKTLILSTAGLALAILAAGCLVGEVSHTLYLEPDGTITWFILERDVRSDEDDLAKRQKEEDSYLSEAWNGRHAMARALATLRPEELETVLIRDVRPFSVMTAGRYDTIAELAWNLMHHAGIRGDTWLERDGHHLRFILALEAEQSWDDIEDDKLAPLIAELEDYHIRLTDGRFTEAVGFVLEDDDTVAIPQERDAEDAENGEFIYSLTWSQED